MSEALRRNPRDGPRTGSDIENGFARLRREKMKDGANHSHIARTSGTVFQHCDAAEIRAAEENNGEMVRQRRQRGAPLSGR
jgi:hypothetical protein